MDDDGMELKMGSVLENGIDSVLGGSLLGMGTGSVLGIMTMGFLEPVG